MANIPIEDLKSKFQSGDYPTQADYEDLIDTLDPSTLQGSLDEYIPLTQKGANGGVATLDTSGQIPSSQLGNVDVSGAIAAVIDSAPGALNTLNELAAALGDDPNFATTVTSALGNKQDKVSGVSDTEIGYLDGVTSAIQTQLDAKAPTDSPTFTTQVRLPSSVEGPNPSTSVNMLFGTGAGHITLGGSQTTGNLTIGGGAGRTTGAINIGTGATTTGTKTINIGTGQSGSSTQITLGSATGTSSTYLYGVNYANNITSASNSVTGTLFNNNTTGGVQIGGGLTTGNLNIAFGSSFAGTINLGTGAGTSSKTINIGTASTAGTTAITLGSSAGATSNITLNGDITLPSTTSIGNVSATEIGYLDGVTSSIQTQLNSKASTSYADAAAAAAAAAIVDSAPGALNTLNELAAAINDDASYAATITTALGNKADITNPSFTVNTAASTISGATTSSDGGGYYNPSTEMFTAYVYYGDSINRFAVGDIFTLTATASGTFVNVPFRVTSMYMYVAPSGGNNGTWQLDFETLTTIATSSTDYYGTTPSELQAWSNNYGTATIGFPESSKTISAAEIAGLDGVSSNIQGQLNSIQGEMATKASIYGANFLGYVSGISKAMVGLGNVDNTSDVNKPISSATQTALNAKASASHTHNASTIATTVKDVNANYTLTSADKNTIIRLVNSSQCTITIPDILQDGESVQFINAVSSAYFTGSGIGINFPFSATLSTRYAGSTLIKAGGSYYMVGIG